MSAHLLLVFMNAVPGEDDAFNEWYDRHLDEALQLDGWAAARRYRLDDDPPQEAPFTYLAVYEIEDLDRAQQALMAAREARDALGNAPSAFLHTASHLQDGKQMLWWTTLRP